MPPLPDVLSQPGIMKGEELRRESCVSAFEGTAPLTSGRVVYNQIKSLTLRTLSTLREY
jgi:hypothetical protein